MSHHVIETVTFRVLEGVEEESFLEAAREATAFMDARPGFVQRRLSRAEDGLWIEQVEWASMAEAKAAAADIGKSEHARSFVRAIDGPSVTIIHSELKVSVG